jgi:hypothetical protein
MKLKLPKANRQSSVIRRPLYALRWSLSSIGAYLLWSLPSGVLTCFSAGGRGLYAIISTKDYVRIFLRKMQNKPNFLHFSPKNEDCAEKQTQFKPNFTRPRRKIA